MLVRIPEPEELMTDPQQARAYALADFEEPHQQFVDLFGKFLPDAEAAARVLDLGCGNADVTLKFARAYPANRIDGVDGAAVMLSHGRKAVAAAGLQGRVTLIEGTLPGVRLSRERYQTIISNSLLHHLRDPKVLWQTILEHGQSGTSVFVMDLRRPQSLEQARELVTRHAGSESGILQRDFHNSLLASYRRSEVEQQLADAGLASLRVRDIGDRHLLVEGRLP